MVLPKSKLNAFAILTFFAVVVQTAFVLVNAFGVSERINHAMFINNYIIGVLIVLSLAYQGISKHFLAIAFFGCYMLFLMAQKPFEPEYDVYLTFVRLKLDPNQYFVFSCILFLGLAATYYAYSFSSSRREESSSWLFEYNERNEAFRSVLSLLWIITFPCALYMQAKTSLVRGGMEYTSGYLINVDVPAIIKVGYYMYSTIVLLCLAIKPSKRKLYLVLGSYVLVEGGLQLLQGRRALFASTLFFTLWYLLKYFGVEKIKRKNIIKAMGLILGTVLLFYVVEQARGSSSEGVSLSFIRSFLVSTGGSDSVIANTIARKEMFPVSGVVFLLNPLINNVAGNFVLHKTAVAQGVGYLSQHYSFSHWISYMTEPSLYLSGHGMGSSYLAEVYLAFGLVGVLLVSFIIGWMISKLNRIRLTDNIFRTGLVFFIVRRLFTLPRDGLLSWTGSLIYLVFTYAIIYPIYTRSIRSCENQGI